MHILDTYISHIGLYGHGHASYIAAVDRGALRVCIWQVREFQPLQVAELRAKAQ